MCFLYAYLQNKKLSQNDVQFGVILMALSPLSIFFIATYSESTFLIFSILGFYYLDKNKSNTSVLMGVFLTATRATGVAFAVAIFYDQYKKRGLKFVIFLQAILACSGLFLYCIYTGITTGDFLSFYHAEANWGRTGWMSLDIAQTFNTLIDQIATAWTRDSLAFVVALFLTGVLAFNKLLPEAIFNLLCILPGFIKGSSYGIFYSGARLDVAIITFYIGMVFLCKDRPTLKYLVISLSSLLLLESWFMWVVKAWLD